MQIKSPTVIGEAADKDPYGAVQPVSGPGGELLANGPAAAGKAPEAGRAKARRRRPEKKCCQALPVLPAEQEPASPLPPVKVDPPDPLQFN